MPQDARATSIVVQNDRALLLAQFYFSLLSHYTYFFFLWLVPLLFRVVPLDFSTSCFSSWFLIIWKSLSFFLFLLKNHDSTSLLGTVFLEFQCIAKPCRNQANQDGVVYDEFFVNEKRTKWTQNEHWRNGYTRSCLFYFFSIFVSIFLTNKIVQDWIK